MIAGHFNNPDTYMVKRDQGMNDWLITYTIGGEGYYLISNKKTTCKSGDIVLLRPPTPHQYGTPKGKNWNFLWAHFPPFIAETNILSSKKLSIHHIGSETIGSRIVQAFERILFDLRGQYPLWKELSENALREILLIIAQREDRPIDSRIEETLHLLSNHMNEAISIESLAKSVGLSPSRLSHLFKEVTGSTIINTLNHMRIKQAALLIKYSDRNASEAAIDVGFQNYNNFADQFRKVYGMNPSHYKNQNTKEI